MEAVSQLFAPKVPKWGEPQVEAPSPGLQPIRGEVPPPGLTQAGVSGSTSRFALPRLRLIPWLAGSPVAKSGAAVEARDKAKPEPTSLNPKLQGGGASTGSMVLTHPEPRRRYRYCKPGERPPKEDPCIAEGSWVKWPLGLHPKAFTVTAEMLAKLRDPGPYPENIIDEEEEYRPRPPPVTITEEDIDAMFEAVTGIAGGQTLRSRRAYSQLVEARGFATGAAGCGSCRPESKAVSDRGAYFGERMKLE